MKYSFDEQQRNLVKELDFDPDMDYDEDSSDDLLEAVSERLMTQGFDADYKPNSEGDICEDIITLLTKE